MTRDTEHHPGPRRADHVQLMRTYLGFPSNLTKAEAGWLVLTDSGQVCFYEQKTLDLSKPPSMSAPSVQDAAAKVGRVYAKVRFGDKRRYVYFTGFLHPAGSADGVAELAGGAGGLLGNQVLGSLGAAADVAGQSVELLRNRGYRRRKLDARRAWSALFAGSVPGSPMVPSLPPPPPGSAAPPRPSPPTPPPRPATS
jgi:hypothetical protein